MSFLFIMLSLGLAVLGWGFTGGGATEDKPGYAFIGLGVIILALLVASLAGRYA